MNAHSGLPLIIDIFAGGGGASTGIEMALGRSPDYAIDHSAKALALHEANHPDAIHLDSNIWDVEPTTVTKGRPVGLLWASPDCKHFSKAKGGAPRDRNIRDLAWVIVDWAEKAKPDVILMENVEEFTTWGPVGEDGQPLKWAAGQTFDLWTKRLKKAGCKLKWGELRACDFGYPTIRKRLFLVARRDGRPIVWPKPTHGDPNSKAVRSGKLKPWRTAAECIDWSLPCPSIFDTSETIKKKHGLIAIRPLANSTLARVARGMQRYVLNADEPFTVSLPGGEVATPSVQRFNTGATGQDLRAPLATITANSWIKKPGGAAPLGLITPHLMSLKGTARRSCGVTNPHPTVMAGGGHSALIAPALATFDGHNGKRGKRAADLLGGTSQSLIAPVSTVTATGSQQSLIAPWFAKYYKTGVGARCSDPMHTVTVKDRMGHMQAELSAPPFSQNMRRAHEVAEFLRSQGAWDGGEFVTVTIKEQEFVVVDIGMRMLSPRELFNAQGFPPDYVIEGAWSTDTKSGEWTFHAFPKNVQVSCCGNSVCPGLAKALVEANCGHLIAGKEAAE